MPVKPNHPYSGQPATSFWSRSVSRHWDARNLISPEVPILKPTDKIMSAGSCFAANIIPFFEATGFEYVRTEFVESQDKYGYGLYSAAYGNIYTPRQLRQLLLRSLGRFKPIEDRWHDEDGIIDPYRPGLADRPETDEEFDLVQQSHFNLVLKAVQQATVFVFTLGLTEAWISSDDGAAFPACPGTISGSYDEKRHIFHNFSAAEITDDLQAIVGLLAEINPDLRTILTISPVPLVATATKNHVVTASIYSKSVLRVACEDIVRKNPTVTYFPAYEIVTGPHSEGFVATDLRNVSEVGVRAVMDVLFHHCELPGADAQSAILSTDRRKRAEALSKLLSDRECEEVAADASLMT